MTSYIRKSIPRPEGNPGVGLHARDLMALYRVDDIAFMPEPDAKGVVIEDDIILKNGRYGIELYVTPGTIELASAAEGDTDQVGFNVSVKGNHPGNSQEIREFKANELNSKFIIVIRYCSGQPSDLIGTICNPCQLVPSYTGNKDVNSNELTFKQVFKGKDIFIYKGVLTLEEPVALLKENAATLDYMADGLYLADSGAVSITAIEGGSHGALISIGTLVPEASVSVKAGDRILLKDGKDFAAVGDGSKITLRAFNAGGENGLYWIEQSRYTA